MQGALGAVAPAIVGGPDEHAAWAALGVRGDDVGAWKAEGFGPFDAALAQGDGFTPAIVGPYRRQLRRVAPTWVRQGLGSLEGLRWHQAGFTAADAQRCRSQGVDIVTARIRRDGYERGSARRGPANPGARRAVTRERRWTENARHECTERAGVPARDRGDRPTAQGART
jgi:hypothetical protein